MSTINAVKEDIDRSKERLYHLKERICSECKKHISAKGYIICNHCLHGGCQSIPIERKKEVLRLEQLLTNV